MSAPSHPRPTPRELHGHIRGRWIISDVSLGLSDGLVTNLAFLAGFAGAVPDIAVIRLAGIAAMIAGAVSMFSGGLLKGRSDSHLFQVDSARESKEIEQEPEEERQELRQFYMAKGLTRAEADTVVSRVTSDKKVWLEDMLMHELHLHRGDIRNPYKVASTIGLSFLVGAFVPLSIYLLLPSRATAVPASVLVSLVFLFFTGFMRGRLAGRTLKPALEMLLVGAVASAVLYIIGSLLAFV
ncbi:MAG: VIT1/CCC1 transporter family protein [Nitrososphaerota archaeon]|nr:VIT1/CCC1 transporter family protein [Nitrososphaerota archaeon]MDG6938867.1 VIT1/CCC1 transporter family protein [Nitrososphaerota archaeon]